MGRKAAREILQTLIATNATLQAVYDHESKDFSRLSPIAMVYSAGSQPIDRDPKYLYAFTVALWWRRDSNGGDTEDRLDDLSDAIYTLLRTRNDLLLDDSFSRIDYPLVDGVLYNRERIIVIL